MVWFQRLSSYTFESVFSAFCDLPDLMVLHTAQSQSNEERYSFICIDPFARFVAQNGVYTWNEKQLALTDPWSFIQEKLNQYRFPAHPDLPAFQGGAVGYWGYEFAHTLERLPKVKDVIGLPDCVLYFYSHVVAFDHLRGEVLLIATGLPEETRRKHQAQADLICLQARLTCAKKMSFFKGDTAAKVQSNFTGQAYGDAVSYLKSSIRKGDIFQANLTQQFYATLQSNLNHAAWFWALTQHNPAPMSAFMRVSKADYLISSSPERFISLKGQDVKTEPIKGTRKRKFNSSDDQSIADSLLKSEKDRAENVMIVDLMRNDLSRVCTPGTVQVPELCVLKTFETVHHLVSKVIGTLKPDYDAIDLLKAAFPPGSVTGAPKIKAMEVISEVEKRARGPYCGCLGYISFTGDMDTSVIIRTYAVKGDQVYFGAGGAVVLDSNEQAEYEESLAKAYILQEVLLGHHHRSL